MSLGPAPGGERDNEDMTDLGKKTVGGFVKLLIILGGLLFLPAWSPRFWQAWVYLAAYFAASLAITLLLWKNDRRLLERRLRAGPGAEKERFQKWLQAVASLLFGGMFLVSGFDRRLHWSSVPFWLVASGDLAVLLAFFLVFCVLRENSFASGIIEVDPEQTVITTGPYEVVRHPMYAGGALLFLATPFALGSYWALLCVIPMLGVLVARLLDEERYLCDNLAGYSAYRAKVRYRLFPGVW